MARKATTSSYGDRIERVVEHIASHLDDDIDLDALAGIACFSPYHFHRVYRGIMGETPADTLRRRRLHRAAGDLILTAKPLARIARAAGYGSTAAFGRAFAAYAGEPPAAFRARRQTPVLFLPPANGESTMYEVKMIDVPALHLAAREHRGDYQEIGEAFDRLSAWAGAHGLIGPSTRMIGLYYDDPQSVPRAELRSDACFTVGPDVAGNGEVRIIDFPATHCASVVHKGPYAELPRAYDYLYREWLPRSGREPGAEPAFEEYLNNPATVPPTEWLTRVHVPLAA